MSVIFLIEPHEVWPQIDSPFDEDSDDEDYDDEMDEGEDLEREDWIPPYVEYLRAA